LVGFSNSLSVFSISGNGEDKLVLIKLAYLLQSGDDSGVEENRMKTFCALLLTGEPAFSFNILPLELKGSQLQYCLVLVQSDNIQ